MHFCSCGVSCWPNLLSLHCSTIFNGSSEKYPLPPSTTSIRSVLESFPFNILTLKTALEEPDLSPITFTSTDLAVLVSSDLTAVPDLALSCPDTLGEEVNETPTAAFASVGPPIETQSKLPTVRIL